MEKRKRVVGLSVGLWISCGFIAAAHATYVLPLSRTVIWTGNVGVVGDIPSRTTACKTLSPSGGDDTSLIQGAITNCPPGQVVMLNAGTFKISSPITVKSNITLRGAGMGSTIIQGVSGMSGRYLVGMGAGSLGASVNISGGLSKGSTHITTSSAHGWKAGDVILIDQLNDPNANPPVSNIGNNGTCGWCGRSSGSRSSGQSVKVTGVPTSTTATLEIPLYWNYKPALTPQGTRLLGLTTMAGIENLTVDNTFSGGSAQNSSGTILLSGTSNCWVLNTEVIGSYQSSLLLNRGVYRNTIRGCRFHKGIPVTAGDGSASYAQSRAYGINSSLYSSGNLIENNRFYHLSAGLMTSGPFSGNVISYNHISDLYLSAPSFNAYAISFHGGHAFMNLIEGNYIDSRVASDHVWGTKSHITLFRNKIAVAPDRTGGAWDIDVQFRSTYFNALGNILGRGIEGVYSLANSDSRSPAIYRFGYNGDGDGTSAGNDPDVLNTVLRRQNWDSVHNSTVLNDNLDSTLNSTDAVLPASLYLTGKPSWWGSIPWPPIGPDVSPMYPAAPAIGEGTPFVSMGGGQAPGTSPTGDSGTSHLTWQNQAIATQTGQFTATFDLIPEGTGIDAVTVLSNGGAQSFADGAAILRFNKSGAIDARNGDAYAAAAVLTYVAGKTYHARMVADLSKHLYSVYVTPEGGGEILLASDFAFRTEQSTVSQLNNVGIYASAGSHLIRNISVVSNYAITANAGPGGSISPAGVTVATAGTSQAFQVIPSTTHTISDVKVDGVSIGPVSQYVFENLSGDHAITAAFAIKTYAITASAGPGGSISPSGSVSVSSGGSQIFTLTPSSSYKVANAIVDGASVGAVSSYGFSNVTGSHIIKAAFEPAGSGLVWQNQPMATQTGQFTATFDLIANGTGIDALTVLSNGAAQNYADGAAIVRFNKTGTIDARNGDTYAATLRVPYVAGRPYHVRMLVDVTRHTYTVYVTPDGGSRILLASNFLFRTEQSAISQLNNMGIYAGLGSHQLRDFAIVSNYTLAASAGAGGSISPAGSITVASGASRSFMISAKRGYVISDVRMDGVSVGKISSYTISNIGANHTIRATFARK
ncbi:MAG: hypothetical protein A2X94_10490 [Bdellovibrionales bacterium GWB1_55_8]|nr:MAG: hypothetical protein A2X94_10490 [Bdellovibrionales bacterium GWB1_55_8]